MIVFSKSSNNFSLIGVGIGSEAIAISLILSCDLGLFLHLL